MLINARSLKKPGASASLSLDLYQKSVDICLVTETWLNESIDSAYVSIPKYTLVRKDRNNDSSEKSHGGGVAAYVRTPIELTLLEYESQGTEMLWFSTVLQRKKFVCGVAYYPPSVNKVNLYTEHILSVYDQLLSEDVETVITLAGDFNDFDVKLITVATALDSLYHGKTHKNSQLDFIFTTHPAYYKSTYTFDVSFPTDHAGIICEPATNYKPKKRFCFVRDQRAHKIQALNLAMDRFNFSVVSKIDDPNQATRALLEALSTLLNENCPVKKIKMTDKDPTHVSPMISCSSKRNQSS